MMNIILTGATGTLGSKVLYELLTSKFDEIQTLFLLVRNKNKSSATERIQNVLQSEFAPIFIKENSATIAAKIKVIAPDDFFTPSTFLVSEDKNYFIHSAGYVNLSLDPNQKDEIFEENYGFTERLFNTYEDYISKFIYISTAFSIGDIGGVIENDYLKTDQNQYRNEYETSKHRVEKFLVEEGKNRNIKVQILRPSVLGGDILDVPNFFISKYMVFYLFAKFFYKSTSSENIRISVKENTGLNIIPTDYVAKVIVKVFDMGIEQLNIVHSKGTNLINGISKILETVDFNNFSFTEEIINDEVGYETNLEKFYYETIGKHLSPYLNSKPHEWDTTLLESILPIPQYDLVTYLEDTITFAKAKNFRNERW